MMQIDSKYKYLRRVRKKAPYEEQGIALVSVLCLIFTGSMIVAGILAMSRFSQFTVIPYTEMQRSFYINEGVANRVQYLISADRDLYGTQTQITDFDYSDYDVERFIPDGSKHSLNYYGTPVTFEIHDAAAQGLNLSSGAYTQTLQNLLNFNETDTDLSDLIESILDQITDYTDTDDTVTGDYGMEDAEFEAAGKAPLPSNSNMQYREEMFYLPKVMQLFPPDEDGRLSGIKLIPPTGVSLNGVPSILTASDLYLKGVCGLEDSEITSVRDAIADYYQNKTPINDALDNTILTKLQAMRTELRWNFSNTYTVIIRPDHSSGEKKIGKRLVFTYQPSTSAGPGDGFVRFFEWMFF